MEKTTEPAKYGIFPAEFSGLEEVEFFDVPIGPQKGPASVGRIKAQHGATIWSVFESCEAERETMALNDITHGDDDEDDDEEDILWDD